MGRETDDEREARRKKAGAWLDAEMKRRDWSQRYLAEQLGVTQQQVSLYVRGRFEMDPELARELARLFELTEYEVWKGMRIPLPRELDDEEAIARALELAPEVMEKVTGLKPSKTSRVSRRSVDRQRRDVRPGEKRRNPDRGEESAV